MKPIVLLFTSLFFSAVFYGQTYFLQGDATFIGDDCYRLTTTQTNQNGAVWYADQINLEESFDLEFIMNFGNLDAQGADGICFVMQTVGTNALGQSGGGLGFLGFSPAFAIEFDTWQNGEYNDPVYDHIGMISNGDVSHISENALSVTVPATPGTTNIEDGEDHVVRIVWNPETQGVQVYFDCEFRIEEQIDLVNDIFNGQSSVTWGFTAGTGGSFNNQTVCLQDNILSTGPDALICNGGSIELSASGNPNGEFTWEPATYLDDPNSQTPICTPEENITYTVTSTDLCGNELSATINITVEDLEAEINGSQLITCDTPSVTLNGSSNFGNNAEYSWSSSDGGFNTGTNAPSVVVNAGGTYTLEVSVDGSCLTEVDYIVEENTEAPNVDIEVDGEITCDNNTVALETNAVGDDMTFVWMSIGGNFVGPTNEATAEVSEAGVYNLTLTSNLNGCSFDTSVVVNDNLVDPTIFPGIADSLSCLENAVTVENATVLPENALVQWSSPDGTGISGTQSLNPVITAPGWYYITATNPENGCSANDSLQVVTSGDLSVDFSNLTFPNIFTPNNDNRNDRFIPFLADDPGYNVLAVLDHYELEVYNRWGVLVFSTDGTPKAFDGKDLNEGTYFFIARYESICGGNSVEPISGSFKLTR